MSKVRHIGCLGCGAAVELGSPRALQKQTCPSCGTRLPQDADEIDKNLSRSLWFAVVAVILLGPAFLLPMLRVVQMTETIQADFVEGVNTLFQRGEYLLAAVVGICSGLLPPLKLLVLIILCLAASFWKKHSAKLFKLLKWLGPLGFVEVFLSTMMLFAFKFSDQFEIAVLPGMYWFIAMAVCNFLATVFFDRRAFSPHYRAKTTAGAGAVAAPQKAVYAKEFRVWIPIPVATVALLALGYGVWGRFSAGQTFSVYAVKTFNLREGSPIREGTDGPVIGSVLRIANVGGERPFEIVGQIKDDAVSKRVLRKSTLMFIEQLWGEALDIKGISTLSSPTKLVLWTGDPEADSSDEFVCQRVPPPNSDVTWWNQPVWVSGSSLDGLAFNGDVRSNDGVIGSVWRTPTEGIEGGVDPFAMPDDVRQKLGAKAVTIVLHTSNPKTPYRREGAAWWKGEFKSERFEIRDADDLTGMQSVFASAGDPEAPEKCTFDFRPGLRPNPLPRYDDLTVEVEWLDVQKLQIGAPVRNGTVPGFVYDLVKSRDKPGWTVHIKYQTHRDSSIPEAVDGALYYLARPATERLEFRNADTFRGTEVIVSQGNPAGARRLQFDGREELPPDPLPQYTNPTLKIYWYNVRGLEIGAPVYIAGRPSGVVDQLRYVNAAELPPEIRSELIGSGAWEVVVKITSTDQNPGVRTGIQAHIADLQTQRLQVRFAEASLKGAFVVLVPGDPKGEPVAQLVGRSEPPPHPLVRFDSPRFYLDLVNADGLEVGDPVKENGGRQLGEISRWVPSTVSGMVRAEIVQIVSSPDLRSEEWDFYVNAPQIGPEGIQGSLQNVVYGNFLEVIRNPTRTGGSLREVAQVLPGPPPLYRPRVGEQEFALNSPWNVPAGAPVTYLGETAGYIRVGGTNNVRMRIYPEFVPFLRPESVFFRERGMQFSAGWQGASFDLDPSTLMRQIMSRQAVEFRTNPECSGPIRPGGTFVLHEKIEKEWLEWQPAIVNGSMVMGAEQWLPRSYPVHFQWAKEVTGFNPKDNRTARGIVTENGWLISRWECLVPQSGVAEKDLINMVFTVNGKACKRGAITSKVVGTGIMAIRVSPEVNGPVPIERLGSAETVRDLWVVLAPNDLRHISRNQLTANKGLWQVNESFFVRAEWDGAPVADPLTGKIVGILLCEDGDNPRIAMFANNLQNTLKL